MAKEFAVLVLLAKFLSLNCQEEELVQDLDEHFKNDNGKPNYSFSYGVSDAHTGDLKAVWETKEGDTVKGHYSVLEPDGTIRSVEYTAGPKTGFTAVVSNENNQPPKQNIGRSIAEPKSMRNFDKFYDFSEGMDEEDFYERKRDNRPFDPYKEKENSNRKRPKYPFDLEPSEYTHSITIKHPSDDLLDGEAHSHVGYSSDPNCKTKTKKESYDHKDNFYSNNVDFELSKPNKYPNFEPDSIRETPDKYADSSNYEFEKIRPYGNNKYSKYEELRPSSNKYNYPFVPDTPLPENNYPEEIPPPRPRKKHRPYKVSDFPSDDLDDYILIPKKKYKPMRVVEPNDYRHEQEDEYRPLYSGSYGDPDDRIQPVRVNTGNTGNQEVIRKIVKKRRPPIINLLDILDI